MEDLELVIKCPECGNIGIRYSNPDLVKKDGQQQVICQYYKCHKDFYRTHPEFILTALIENVKGLEEKVEQLLSFKEHIEDKLTDELEKINLLLAELTEN
jgi:hypothetical protein